MTWSTPSAEEVKMDAEIGSYNLDEEPLDSDPRHASPDTEQRAPRRPTT